MKNLLLLLILICSQSLNASPLWLRYPSISPDGTKIAFSYQGDIFLVNVDGGKARQITSHSDYDYMPIWSHNSQQIAFSSNRYGNFDVFLTDINGTSPKRLTFHSSNDLPNDFSIDNKKVIFTASRLDHPNSVQFPYRGLNEIYEVSVLGGREKQVLTVAAEKIKYANSGQKIIFQNKKGYENEWRKHHTSSVTRDIVTYNFKTKKFKQITDWNGEDRDPIFSDENQFYFLSEKGGTFNVWQGNLNGNSYEKQITNFKNHPVRFLSKSNSGVLCFSYDGEIYLNSNGKSEKLNIVIYKDNSINNAVLKKVSKGISQFELSPNNKEIAFIYRGDVFCTSIDYSTTKRITNSAGQERSVSFSPDGKSILFAGERDNSWNIYEVKHSNESEKYFFNATLLKEINLINNGEETFQPTYSPDGKEVAFLENRTTIRVINLKSKKERTVLDGKYNYSYSDGDQYYIWSPDSKWILTQFFEFDRWSSDIGLVNANGNDSPLNLTQSGYNNGGAKFAMNGEMVYYSTNKYGYRSHGSWGAQSDVEAIFLTDSAHKKFTLNKEDYEFWQEEQKEIKKDTTKKEDLIKELKIELDNIYDRRVKLTIHSSFLMDFYVNNEATSIIYLSAFEKNFDLWQTKFRDKETKLVSKLGIRYSNLIIDSTEKNIYINNKGSISKLDLITFKSKPVSVSAEYSLDLSKEREYMFYHAWRQVKEKFYVENLHGVKWNELQKYYSKFLPHVNNGYDFSEMLSEILGELNASHTGSGYRNFKPNGDQTAVLGCYYDESFEENGLKIIEIMDKSPLLSGTKKIVAGCIIEKIDNIEIEKNKNYLHLLNRKIGKKVLFSFYNPKTKERWNEIIKPISTRKESELAYQRFVKRAEEQVDKLSNGQLGYIHIKGMNSSSFRTLFDKALGKFHKKKAIIIDTRFNGGGWLHDDLATFLSGKLYMSFEPRGQTNMGGEPIWKWQKTSCVLMSEGNYSDAHLFPYTYKALGIGKLIGMPVPGTGTAVWWETLIDGQTYFGIPQVGMKSTSEGYLVENHELQPDILVNNDYDQFINGIDQQLISAVNELLKK